MLVVFMGTAALAALNIAFYITWGQWPLLAAGIFCGALAAVDGALVVKKWPDV